MISSDPPSWLRDPQIPVVQCAANFSEGARWEVLEAIVSAAGHHPEAVVADWSADPDHNRMVLSLLGTPEGAVGAVLAAARVVIELVDLRLHSGAHPRMGVIDVVPFAPIRNTTLEECQAIAERCGHALLEELHVPVYFYAKSARPGRLTELPAIRHAVRATGHGMPRWMDYPPDLGTAVLPSRGTAVVGARPPLVAYNVFVARGTLNDARAVARQIRSKRTTEPVLHGVRALGLMLVSRGLPQVSMNLTAPHRTTLPRVYAYVATALEQRGAEAGAGEVIGLVSEATLGGVKPGDVSAQSLKPSQVVEYWLGTSHLLTGVT